MSALTERITAYLSGGGLFNPELANHDAVRDLLIECRDALSARSATKPTAGEPGDGRIVGWLLVQPNGLPMLREDGLLWFSAARMSGYKSDYEAGCKDVALYAAPAAQSEAREPVEVEVIDSYVMDLVRRHGSEMTNSEIVAKFLPKQRVSAQMEEGDTNG